jgi:hypothetical protein
VAAVNAFEGEEGTVNRSWNEKAEEEGMVSGSSWIASLAEV